MEIDAQDLDKRGHYFLMTSLVVPRPVAWIGTRGPEGDNLAPFSYFMGVSSDPPLLAVSIARGRGGAVKDTLRNLERGGVCTVSLVAMEQLEQMHACGMPFPPDQDEFEQVGIDKAQGPGVDAPSVAGSLAVMGCKLHQLQDLGSTHLVLLEVLAYRLDPAHYSAEAGRMQGLDPVARMGAGYASVGPERVL